MSSKLDTFNKDKAKCEKCKKYFDKNDGNGMVSLCNDCYKKCRQGWESYKIQRNLPRPPDDWSTRADWTSYFRTFFEEFMNEKQTRQF